MASQSITITLTAPTNQNLSDMLDHFVYQNGYQDLLADGSPNPETKPQFLKRMTQAFWLNSIKARKTRLDAETARAAASSTIDSLVTLT